MTQPTRCLITRIWDPICMYVTMTQHGDAVNPRVAASYYPDRAGLLREPECRILTCCPRAGTAPGVGRSTARSPAESHGRTVPVARRSSGLLGVVDDARSSRSRIHRDHLAVDHLALVVDHWNLAPVTVQNLAGLDPVTFV